MSVLVAAALALSVDLSGILGKMSSANQALSTLQADIVQQKSYPQLGISDPEEKGDFAVKRKPGAKLLVRIEFKEPETRIVTLQEKKFLLYQPRIKQAIEGTVDEKGATRAGTSFLSYFLGGLAQAKNDFEIALVGEETVGSRKTWHLKLSPKPGSKAPYRQIDLWVDQEWAIPVQQQFIEPNQNQTTLRFDRMRINGEIPDSHFTVKLPADVERVRG